MCYICCDCGAVFEEPRTKINVFPYGEGTAEEEYEVCPECGFSMFEEAEQCEGCGEWFEKNDLKGGLCPNCLINEVTVDTAFEYAESRDVEKELIENILTQSEIKDILLDAAKAKAKLGKTAGMIRFVMEDEHDFGDFLKKRAAV